MASLTNGGYALLVTLDVLPLFAVTVAFIALAGKSTLRVVGSVPLYGSNWNLNSGGEPDVSYR